MVAHVDRVRIDAWIGGSGPREPYLPGGYFDGPQSLDRRGNRVAIIDAIGTVPRIAGQHDKVETQPVVAATENQRLQTCL